ncbi:MAG: WXG100 family type VII secretion target, partial [Gemmataceae bacterium]
VDPAELRRLAAGLKRFNSELSNQMASLHGQLINLGESWRDQEHQKFAEEFVQTMKVMQKFLDASQQHIPFLLRKAERIEDYLQQK